MDSIKDVVRSSVKVSELDKHLKKAGGQIDRNVVEITIKMNTITRKPLTIKNRKWNTYQFEFYGISTFLSYLMPNPFLYEKSVLFQTIQFRMSTQFNCQKSYFQAILFCISTQFSSIWLIDRNLSGANTPNQSGLGSDGNEMVLRIPQNSSITGSSPSVSKSGQNQSFRSLVIILPRNVLLNWK